jgi:3,4-dihydroxy 2-butanone 4-phosphate synthase/GTP cyclohydrolase II
MRLRAPDAGDLIMAGEFATQESIAFFVRHTSGVICVSVPGPTLEALELPPMCHNNEDPKGTAFTVSTDVRAGTTTGISAADRAATFRALADPASRASDFMRPGHVFPLRPRSGGVLERGGHTEAAVDFCKLAGLRPCGVLSEIVNDDGSMARVPDLVPFCERHNLVLTSIDDLQQYIKETRAPM